jgi:hypothetical protein
MGKVVSKELKAEVLAKIRGGQKVSEVSAAEPGNQSR